MCTSFNWSVHGGKSSQTPLDHKVVEICSASHIARGNNKIRAGVSFEEDGKGSIFALCNNEETNRFTGKIFEKNERGSWADAWNRAFSSELWPQRFKNARICGDASSDSLFVFEIQTRYFTQLWGSPSAWAIGSWPPEGKWKVERMGSENKANLTIESDFRPAWAEIKAKGESSRESDWRDAAEEWIEWNHWAAEECLENRLG